MIDDTFCRIILLICLQPSLVVTLSDRLHVHDVLIISFLHRHEFSAPSSTHVSKNPSIRLREHARSKGSAIESAEVNSAVQRVQSPDIIGHLTQ